MDIVEARRQLRARSDLERDGIGAAELRRQVNSRTLVRVRAGAYVAARDWDACFADERHTFEVVAAASAMRGGDLVMCLVSAAVLHGLPLYRLRPRAVHVAGRRCDGRAGNPRRHVARHDIAVGDDDRTVICGIPCTSLDRTVFDVIRVLPFDTAVACADAALRQVAWDRRAYVYRDAVAAEWKSQMRERIHRAAGRRGIRQARRVLDACDGRADGPLESISRLRLVELGFRDIRLQVSVPGPNGCTYHIDFGLEDVRGWGEADGNQKYHDLRMRNGATAREVLDAEKAREDWIRGTTQRPMARWGHVHAASAAALGARLAAFGMLPTR